MDDCCAATSICLMQMTALEILVKAFRRIVSILERRRITFPACRAHYPTNRTGALGDHFPVRTAFPVMQAGRRRTFTFEACSAFTHVAARRIARPPQRPLSRGFDQASCLTKPLVSYRSYRQLSGGIFLHW
jgi:hypothetical protein